MAGYSTNIESDTLGNENFRQVLFTGAHSQLVLMTLQPGDEIGTETHDDRDQFFRIEAGTGEAIIEGETFPLSDDIVVIVPAGAEHNVVNTSNVAPLRLYSIYSPPEHPDGTIHKTKAEADEAERLHHG